MPPRIICFINQKGGCGKSSTCFHLAGRLAQVDERILLVDADPQGSLSQGFFGAQLVECLTPHETLAAIFSAEALVSQGLPIAPTGIGNISIARSNQHLAAFNSPSPQTTGLRQFALQAGLSHASDFDFILIDCPPNLYQCSWNALLAADYVIIPVPPEDFGTQGLRPVHQAIENARLLNPKLELLGQLITRSDGRLLVHRAYEQELRRMYGPLMFRTVVPEASAFKVSLACRLPVTHYAPHSKAATSITQLATEIFERIEADKRRARLV